MKSVTSGVRSRSVKGKHLTLYDREKIEQWLDEDCSVVEIAKRLGKVKATIYNEIKKGTINLLDSDTYTFVPKYSAHYAQKQTDINKSRSGRKQKLANDYETAHVLEDLIKAGYSPYASLIMAEEKGKLKTKISLTTLYTYIYNGTLDVSDEDLPYGRYNVEQKIDFNKRKNSQLAVQFKSIEERPLSVLSREEFGHWEGDTVVGKQGETGAFLTLVERKSRFFVSVWIPNRKTSTIVSAFDYIELSFGSELFRAIFKSITFDNGSEFSDVLGIQTSCVDAETLRVKDIYFAHPFCSGERGSNEVIHRFIRRQYPKGTSLINIDCDEYRCFVERINKYPRALHGGKTARDLFCAELEML